ncbi:ATP-binding protein [Catellatospora vulcania]|uniref:ATP-binding protein n=1 Tax=Catellatospora vulcania TaxID=1460450 RepID=UPI0018AF7547|nr:ATP-binding protein [Catellatospora vulcania]
MQQVAEPFKPPPAHTATTRFDTADDLAGIRRIACETATAGGLTPQRAAALEVAVSEIATNTLRYTPDGGTLRVWADDGFVTCEITDRGTYRPHQSEPTPEVGGWGLNLAAEISDGLYVHSRPGCSVWRLMFRL